MKIMRSKCLTWRRENAGFREGLKMLLGLCSILTALNEQAGSWADTSQAREEARLLGEEPKSRKHHQADNTPTLRPSVRKSLLHGTPGFLREEQSPAIHTPSLPFHIMKPTVVQGV